MTGNTTFFTSGQSQAGHNEHGTLAGGIFEKWYNDYNSWLDEHGLATGALAFAEKFVLADGRPYYFDTSHIERDKKKVAEGYITRRKKRGVMSTEIKYHVGHRKYITITDYEMTVAREYDSKAPYEVYRPFKEADGTIKFRLVHEKIDRNYHYDEVPAYVNYLLVAAKRQMWEKVDDGAGANWHAVQEIFDRAKPLSKFNQVPVTDPLKTYYLNFLEMMTGTREEAVTAAASLVVEALLAERLFHARTRG